MSEPLATTTWGSGERTVLLLHGQFGSAATWWRIGPTLAGRGYRVVAVDLPGHGSSQADGGATIDSCVRQIHDICPAAELAIGHSLGGLVLGVGAERLGVQRTILVDTPLRYESPGPADSVRQRLAEMKASRTVGWLGHNRPEWSDEDRRVEADAAERFDIDTSLSLMTSMAGLDLGPLLPDETLVVAPDRSRYLSLDDVGALERVGVAVRRIEGAGHTVWYGHHDAFMAAIDDRL